MKKGLAEQKLVRLKRKLARETKCQAMRQKKDGVKEHPQRIVVGKNAQRSKSSNRMRQAKPLTGREHSNAK